MNSNNCVIQTTVQHIYMTHRWKNSAESLPQHNKKATIWDHNFPQQK